MVFASDWWAYSFSLNGRGICHAYSYTNIYFNANSHIYRNAGSNEYSDSNGNVYANPYSYRNIHRNVSADEHLYADGDCYRCSCKHGDPISNRNPWSSRDSNHAGNNHY